MENDTPAEREERGHVQVTRPRNWWRNLYVACLSEFGRAIEARDNLDAEHVARLLPVLSEAADDQELEALEADMRLSVGRPVEFAERQEAKLSVRWIGTPPAYAVGG